MGQTIKPRNRFQPTCARLKIKRLLKCLSLILQRMLNQSAPLDLAFHALADPTRRAMVERLALSPASVSDLARPLAMSLPAVMQHLAVLEGSGLVVSQKIGRVRTCRIEPGALGRARQWIDALRLEWGRRLDRLEEYLKEVNEGVDR
jgi:DNA-binding transcriptional ArsR family regulator